MFWTDWLLGSLAAATVLAVVLLASAGFAARQQLHGFVTLALLACALRLIVGVFHITYGPLPGADVDAIAFEEVAAGLADEWRRGHISLLEWTARYSYANAIALVYYVVGRAPLLLPVINSGFTVLAMANICGTARAVGAGQSGALFCGAVIALHPAGILYAAVPLREAAMLAGFAIVLRSCVDVRSAAALLRPRLWIGLVALFALHPGTVVAMGMPVLALGIYTSQRWGGGRLILPGVAIGVLLTFVAIDAVVDLSAIPKIAWYFSEDGSLDLTAVAGVQQLKARGDGAYALHFLNTGKPMLDLLLVGPEAVGRLLFSPMPWELGGGLARSAFKVVDVGIFMILVAMSVYGVRREGLTHKRTVVLLFFILMASAFGIASANDGIAMRHRAKLIWGPAVLAAVAVPRRQPNRDADPSDGGLDVIASS